MSSFESVTDTKLSRSKPLSTKLLHSIGLPNLAGIMAKTETAICEEAYMMYPLSCSDQTYNTHTVLPVVALDGQIMRVVTATDSNLTLQLAIAKMLHNLRTVVPKKVDTLAGVIVIHLVGDMMIPHLICGSIIMHVACITSDQ